ncbi:aldo/keto reductase [Marinilabilia sp.]|jgi:aryl-alcohol dehydrogenase-like predicted oxidoreductase
MKRRTFIRNATFGLPLLSLFPADLSGIKREKPDHQIEKRSLGKTGEMLSIIGFGGIVVMNATPQQAASRVKEAISYGVNYFDVAPTYGDAEIKLGPALKPYRKNVFLACKTQERTREGAKRELEQSLKNMQTDYFDLYQHHAVTSLKDVETIFATGGAMEAFLEAKEEGKIKYMGFSAHSVEAALALMEGFDFDTILFPVSYNTWYAGNFGAQVLEKAKEKGMGILALKAMAKGPWPEGTKNKIPKCWYEPLSEPKDALRGLRFTLSHPATSAIPPGNENLFSMALKISNQITPMEDSEILNIKKKALKEEPLFTFPQKA